MISGTTTEMGGIPPVRISGTMNKNAMSPIRISGAMAVKGWIIPFRYKKP
jgi:hypothetical protein